MFYFSYLLSSEVFAPASRRLCNMAFVMYHTACVLAGCLMGAFMEVMSVERQINLTEDAVNYN